MAQPDLEDVIDAAIAVFKSQFPEQLSAVDARKAKPLSPRPPQQYYFGDAVQTPLLPCMVVTGHKTHMNSDEYAWRNQTYILEIEGYATADSVENVSRIVRRYGAAIDETLRQNNTLGGTAGVKNIGNITQEYWDTMKQETALFQVVRVTFEVELITD